MSLANLTAGYLRECMVDAPPRKREVNLEGACRRLITQLNIPSCPADKLTKSLDKNRIVTLSAIVSATENGIIDIEIESGKEIWRNIFRYLYNRDLIDELAIMEEKFYEVSAPVFRQRLLDVKVDFVTAVAGVFINGPLGFLSLAGFSYTDTAEYLRDRAYKKNISCRVYNNRKTSRRSLDRLYESADSKDR